MSYILVGSLTRLKTLVYKINGAEYIQVYIKHNGELNPGIIPNSSKMSTCKILSKLQNNLLLS